MKLIVGLGNPSKEYEKTRHNLGFMIIDNYLKDVCWQKKFNSLIYHYHDQEIDVFFMKPQQYMNNSGLCIKEMINYYDIDVKDILIIYDDVDLPVGSYKIKCNSSSGGHNGIKSIIENIKTKEFARLKIGVGNDTKIARRDYVLNKFSKEEIIKIQNNYNIYNNIIDTFIIYGQDKTMNVFNTKDKNE